jgi:TonB family protein
VETARFGSVFGGRKYSLIPTAMLKTYLPHKKVRIPEPCHEDWAEMTPAAQGRFCASCSKVVVDFSDKNPKEVQNILKEKSDEKVCGKWRQDQLAPDVFEVVAYRNAVMERRQGLRIFAMACFFSFGLSLFSCTTENLDEVRSTGQLVDVLYRTDRSDEMKALLLQTMQPTEETMSNMTFAKLIPPPLIEGRWAGMMVTGIPAAPEVPFYEEPPIARTSAVDNATYTVVEKMPEFPGGEARLFRHLGQVIDYPREAKEAGVSGTVYIEFVVDREGDVQNAHVLRGLGYGLDREALAAVNDMPSWSAGKQRGQDVNVRMVLPIKFTLK